MEQLILHLIGDFVTQSHWMATEKTKRLGVALLHAAVYALPFLLIGSWQAVAVVFSTHAVIDRYRLAVYVCRWKNRILAPPHAYGRDPLSNGYPVNAPAWLAVWLVIAADNTLHLTINWLALEYL